MAPECGGRLVEISYPPCGVGRIDRHRQGIENLSEKVVTQVRLLRLGNDKTRCRARTRAGHNVSHSWPSERMNYRKNIKHCCSLSISRFQISIGGHRKPSCGLRRWCFSA